MIKAVKQIVVIIVIVTLSFGCSPLKQVRKSGKTDSKTVDNSTETLIRKEVERQIVSLSQVVVEFFPPLQCDTPFTLPIIPSKNSRDCDTLSTLSTIKTTQPIKRIVRTNINLDTQRSTQTDSTIEKDIVESVDSIYNETISEKPANAVQGIKWITIAIIGIAVILVIILIYRYL